MKRNSMTKRGGLEKCDGEMGSETFTSRSSLMPVAGEFGGQEWGPQSRLHTTDGNKFVYKVWIDSSRTLEPSSNLVHDVQCPQSGWTCLLSDHHHQRDISFNEWWIYSGDELLLMMKRRRKTCSGCIVIILSRSSSADHFQGAFAVSSRECVICRLQLIAHTFSLSEAPPSNSI